MSNVLPALNDFLTKAKQITHRLTYPINGFDDITKSLGGEGASVEWEGRQVSVTQALNLIPGYVFPIEGEDDAVAIGVNLELLRPGSTLQPQQMGRQMAPDPSRTPPSRQPASILGPKSALGVYRRRSMSPDSGGNGDDRGDGDS